MSVQLLYIAARPLLSLPLGACQHTESCRIKLTSTGCGGNPIPSIPHICWPSCDGLDALPTVVPAPFWTFGIYGFSAGSCGCSLGTGHQPCLASRYPSSGQAGHLSARICLHKPCRSTVRLIHAREDQLCIWAPTPAEFCVLHQRLLLAYVYGKADWMGASRHSFGH